MKTMERVRILLARYQQKKITAAEFDELLIWLFGLNDEEVAALAEDQQAIWEQAKAGTLPGITEQVNWDRMLEEVLANRENVHQMKPRRLWLKIAAAASLLILLGTAVYLLFDNKKSRTAAVIPGNEERRPENVLPLTNQTVLTLEDGRRIMLDSAGNGQLADNIKKIQNGEIVYQQTDPGGEPEYHTITVPRGGRPYELQLSDGSRIWLNTATSLRYPSYFKGESREVEIYGEGYFEIAAATIPGSQTRMPFHVKHKGMDVEVKGTHFNVMAYEDEPALQTTLLEGLVTVNGQLLKPGQQAQYKKGEVTINPVNTDIAVAWVNGYFHFDKTELGTILRQVGRWYDLEIVFKGPVSSDLYSGKIERNLPLSSITKLFSGIQLRIEGKKLIVE